MISRHNISDQPRAGIQSGISCLFLLLTVFIGGPAKLLAGPPNAHMVLDLRGEWLFDIGDNSACSKPDYRDRGWTSIPVPGSWEDGGFPGYDGYAWYRVHFSLDQSVPHQNLVLDLGIIDDIDETYLNGYYLGGAGRFPPEYETAYSAIRYYVIPQEYLNQTGDNVLAVRVFDEYGPGGIVSGHIGLWQQFSDVDLLVDLSGIWKFNPKDIPRYRDEQFEDEHWREIIIPSTWEHQGYWNYDGFAWYRRTFRMPHRDYGDVLYLALGRIDDMDKTYLNGKLIGTTGEMVNNPDRIEVNDVDHRTLRLYKISRDLLNPSGDNVIAVRVYDGYNIGGIKEGPLGILTEKQAKQLQIWEAERRDKEKMVIDLLKNLLKGFGIEAE